MIKQFFKRLWSPFIFLALFTTSALLIDDLKFYLLQYEIFPEKQLQEILTYIIHIGIWLTGACLFNRLIGIFFWERSVARTIGGKVPRLLEDVVTIIIYLIAVTGIVGIVFEKPVTGIWATSGAVGLVLGFALQRMILDVFTGLASHIEQPYAIGEWIMVHSQRREQNIIGQVIEINWRTTRLLTEERNIVVIPNSVLGSMIVTNFWKQSQESRFHLSFNLDFSIPVERARRILVAGVKAVLGKEGLLEQPEPEVIVSGATTFGIEYQVRYWITPWNTVSPPIARHRITASILEHLRQAGITVAYPKQDIFYDKMPVRNLDINFIDDRRKLLSKIELFEHLEAEELEKLATAMKQRFYIQGENLIKKGEAGSSMFILVEGLLSVMADIHGNGREVCVDRIIPGQFFGEMSLLTGEPRSATITAATDIVAYEITKEVMNELLQRKADTAATLSRIVAERRLRNLQALQKASNREKIEKTKSLAQQILSKMESFFKGVF